MTQGTANANQVAGTPEEAVAFVAAVIEDKKHRIEALRDAFGDLMDRPDADPAQVHAVDWILRAMEDEIRTEWAEFTSFREDFAFP